MLSYLYNDEAGQRQQIDRLRKHPGLATAVRYLQNLLVLAPKRADGYAGLVEVHDFLNDEAALATLLRQVSEAELDLSDARQQALDFYAGNTSPEQVAQLVASMEWYQQIVDETPADARDINFAVAATTLIAQQLRLAQMQPGGDVDRLTQLAEQSHRASPSTATRSVLLEVYAHRAVNQLVDQVPEFAELIEPARPATSDADLLAVGMAESDALSARLLAHADVQRAVSLAVETAEKFPSSSSPGIWSLVRRSHPEVAAELVKQLDNHPADPLAREIYWQLAPFHGSSTYTLVWQSKMRGQPERAAEILRLSSEAGLPLPKQPAAAP